MTDEVTATNIHSEFRSKLEMNEAFFPLFTGELAFLQRCQSAVINMHAFMLPILYAVMQHLN